MRVLVLYIALTLLSALPAWAVDVLIVQGSRNAAFSEALKGFQESYHGSTRTLVLSDYAEVDVVRLVKEERPRLVLAVGDAALSASRKVRQVPVVSLMALATLHKGTTGSTSGVGVVPAPERYLRLCKNLGARRVGVIFDPAKTGWYLQRAREAANRLGVELVALEVRKPRETLARLEQLENRVDAIWMFPDTTAVTAETAEAYFLFSLKQRLPVVTFAAHYLDKGAVAALDADRADMGRQAGTLASRILGSEHAAEATVLDARQIMIHTNPSVAQKLGLSQSALEKIVPE